MFLDKIEAFNYRNFSNINIKFGDLNIIIGKNGRGKSNLLELIYYFFLNRSFKPVSDNQILKYNQQFFSINGTFKIDNIKLNNIKINNLLSSETDNNQSLNNENYDNFIEKKIMYVLNRGKTIKINNEVRVNKEIKNIEFFIPILENKIFYNIFYVLEERRKFFDRFLLLFYNDYKENLILHNKILKMKRDIYNKYQNIDKVKSNIEMLNEKFSQVVFYITEKRNYFFYQFYKELNEYLSSFNFNNIKIVYKSIFKDLEYEQIKYILNNSIEKEYKTERLFGNHTDGIYLYLDGKNIQNILSLGQLKLLFILIILKMIDILENKKNYYSPILIDDFFIDLDKENKVKIFNLIQNNLINNYQIFLTFLNDDYKNENFINTANINSLSIFKIENNNVIQI